MNHREAILALISEIPGLDDDQIALRLSISPRQTVNIVCRGLQSKGLIRRSAGLSGKILNFAIGNFSASVASDGYIMSPARLPMRGIDFAARRTALLGALDSAFARFDKRATFTGPSLHFHLTSLRAAEEGNINRFIEQVYALLPSWGMHRMGRNGPKMVEFETFQSSMFAVEEDLRTLRGRTPSTMQKEDWVRLEGAFRGIRCMRTNVQLIGNSKVLAHWLPNLVPPIDREYTLAFIPYRGDIGGPDRGWRIMDILLREFFFPILGDAGFRTFAEAKLALPGRNQWHSSALKIIDNLLIGSDDGIGEHDDIAAG